MSDLSLPLASAVTVKPPPGHANQHWRHGPTSAHMRSCWTLPSLLEHVNGWGGVGASHCSTHRSGGHSERGEVRMAEATPQGCPAPRRLWLRKQTQAGRLRWQRGGPVPADIREGIVSPGLNCSCHLS